MTPAVAERLVEQAVAAVEMPAATKSGGLVEGVLLLCGWSARETTGAAGAAFELYDGQDDRGQLVATGSMGAGGESKLGPAAAGVGCEGGLYFKSISGSVAGAVWIRAFGQ